MHSAAKSIFLKFAKKEKFKKSKSMKTNYRIAAMLRENDFWETKKRAMKRKVKQYWMHSSKIKKYNEMKIEKIEINQWILENLKEKNETQTENIFKCTTTTDFFLAKQFYFCFFFSVALNII